MTRTRLMAVAVIALNVAACQSSSAEPSLSSPSASATPPFSNFPTGCAPIDLRGPDGSEVDLTGEWMGTNWFSGRSAGERTFILQLGDCVWITVTDERFHTQPVEGEAILGVLLGTIATDFSISGDLVTLLRDRPVGGFSDQQIFAAVRLRVVFAEDGQVSIRENRDPGVSGPRCTHPPSACPNPVELQRVSEP
jgi:hypothetical protein